MRTLRHACAGRASSVVLAAPGPRRRTSRRRQKAHMKPPSRWPGLSRARCRSHRRAAEGALTPPRFWSLAGVLHARAGWRRAAHSGSRSRKAAVVPTMGQDLGRHRTREIIALVEAQEIAADASTTIFIEAGLLRSPRGSACRDGLFARTRVPSPFAPRRPHAAAVRVGPPAHHAW